jgi:hypothetical protein
MKEIFIEMFTERMSDYKVVDIILKIWTAGLLVLFVLGMSKIIFELITNPSSFDNATFGIFDYI